MNPNQFVILNSKNERVIENNIMELQYHSDLLENMDMPFDAKIQIHIEESMTINHLQKKDL